MILGLFAALVMTIGPIPTMAKAADPVPVDMREFHADSGATVRQEGDRLSVAWPMAEGEFGRLVLDLRPGEPLIASLGTAGQAEGESAPLLKGVDPATFLTVGSRVGERDRPPTMSPFNVFFDSPASRPHQAYRSKLNLKRARVFSHGRRATVALGDLNLGPFAGELQLTVYPDARLVHVEAVVSTNENDRAILYDAGLVSADASPGWRSFVWKDTEGTLQREAVDAQAVDRPLAVRHRALVAETDAGSLACFPPPHKFFFPRDLTDNLKTVWSGRGHRGLDDRFGFGVRQTETGGGSFSPWFNAPPNTEQRLGVFYLLSRGTAADALSETLRFTHGDRFPELPGHRTLTSHWHMATTVAAMKEEAEGKGRTTPDFVRMFKAMNVEIVHQAEFHGDGHPQDPGPLRLREMEAMFAECRRLSDDKLLMLPGEEANVHLGPSEPGKNAGHWLYFFPRPVYWTMRRAPDQPFSEEKPGLGTVYHVGNREDMVRLLEVEHGLAWTAHARIKASTWAPDVYRHMPFFKSDLWLGAAWKAMPADLSRPRLGERTLDLLDDMANWGGPKYLLGEVDVFKVDHTHELYAHMNINYVRLDRLPKFDDGWKPVLDAIRGGKFFVTTGEVLMREFNVGGKSSGESLSVADGDKHEARLELEWTFPLRFVEVIAGDGERVSHERIDLSDTGPFGRRTLTFKPELKGRKWVRLEAWDVAGNGSFTQPVWLNAERKAEGR